MAPETVEHRLVAVVHADAAGYSRLMAGDEETTVRALDAHRGIVEGAVRQHRGRLVDFTGDSFLAEFPSSVDAVGACVAIQRQSAAQSAGLPEERRLRLRLGVHAGDVRVEGERIHGDPIHVAARLQALADPGGIVISAAVHEQLAGRLSLAVRDLGPRRLKNLAHPVHAHAVVMDAGGPGNASVPGFSGRPAIAVLAFDPLGDPEQAYLGDGIAEDLITRLATCGEFPVIARTSSFAYRGRAVGVQQIGRELGVAYLIEGSVRRAGERIRITAQLVDARSGHHVWAERYDRGFADVFAVQDEIVEAVVARVYPELERAERERIRRVDPASLEAWESLLLARWYLDQWTREAARRARELAERALALDPECIAAVLLLQQIQTLARVNLWQDLVDSTPAAYAEWVRRAMESSGESWLGWLALGFAISMTDLEGGLHALQRAVDRNPSSVDALSMLANVLTRLDRPFEALPLLETAQRLDPGMTQRAGFRSFSFAHAYLAAGRYADALRWSERALDQAPGHMSSMRVLVASLAELGRLDEAREWAGRLLELTPDFRLSMMSSIVPPQPKLIPRLTAALRKAGIPE